MTTLDWAIVFAVMGCMLYGALFTKKFMRSVADFLAAGRTAGRYVLSVSMGMAMLGAISVVGEFEMFYESGFCLRWWELAMALAILLVTVSGWIYYRFRQTRALTLPQFFEMRYSRRFRIFAGVLAFVSGIINFGIFPAVGARFFIAYCGLPQSFSWCGLQISTYVFTMTVLLSTALLFVFSGGQIAVIVADFIQGVFSNGVFVILLLFMLFSFDWSHIFQAVSSAAENESLINPFKTSRIPDFNFWYFIIGLIGFVYNTMSWQGTQGYNASAKSAHEAKMAQVLGNWRNYTRNLFLMFIPVIAYTVMHHPDYSSIADHVRDALSGYESAEVQNQIRVPLVLSYLLPMGLMGSFAAVMLAAFISTHDTYLHSWGSMFIQDIVLPFRKKPFTKKQHITLLRCSILGVAIFIFLFSLLFRQQQHIYLFFAVTGAIFVGGSGAVLIGGLYWKRGTTAAAWSAMICGSSIAVGGTVLNQLFADFPVNGQWFWGISMIGASLVYVLVSLLGAKRSFDMDKLLNRGAHRIAGEMKIINATPAKGFKVLGMGKEFTRGDKLIYIVTYSWIFLWTAIFIAGTIYNFTHEVKDALWMKYWKYYVTTYTAISVIVIIWFTIGGIKNLKEMFGSLRIMTRDDGDVGFVVKNNEE